MNLLLGFVGLLFLHTTDALDCYTCTNATYVSECMSTTTCNTGEVCFSDYIQTSNGMIYSFGCRMETPRATCAAKDVYNYRESIAFCMRVRHRITADKSDLAKVMDESSVTPLGAGNSTAQSAPSEETLVINVGGVTFETYRSKLIRLPNSPLANNGFLNEHFRSERRDYFFDRDPDAFKIILDFLRTGELYIPKYIDRPSLRNDLQFWGLKCSGIHPMGSNGLAQGQNVNSGTTVTYNSIASCPETTGMKIWNVVSDPATSLLAKIYAAVTYLFMCVSVFIIVFETTTMFYVSKVDLSNVQQDILPDIYRNHSSIYYIAFVLNLFFTAEYVIRVIVAPDRIRFVFSFLGVIDVLAILPDYVLMITSEAFDVHLGALVSAIQILGVFRILRVLRVFKHFKNLMKTEVFVLTFKASAAELVFVGSLFAVGTLVSATVCYYLEIWNGSDGYVHFRNIPEACYWAAITLTTVGYGDMRPISRQGKVWAAFSSMYGLVMIGFLVSVLVTNFMKCSEKLQSRSECQNVAYKYRDAAECRPQTSQSSEGQNV